MSGNVKESDSQGDVPQTTEERALSLYMPTSIEYAVTDYFSVRYGQEIRPLDIELQEPTIEQVAVSDFEKYPELVRRSLPIVVTNSLGERTVVAMEYRRKSPFSDWKEAARAYGEGKVAAEGHGTYMVPEFTDEQLQNLSHELSDALYDQGSEGYESPLALVNEGFIPGVKVRAFEETVSVGLFDYPATGEDGIDVPIDLQGGQPKLGEALAREVLVIHSPLQFEPGKEFSKYNYGLVWSFPKHEHEVAETLRYSRPRHFYPELPAVSSTQSFPIKANYLPEVMIEMLYNMVDSRTT